MNSAQIAGETTSQTINGIQPFISQLELAVLVGLSDGLQSKEIAESIGRSAATVESYVRSLYAKLGARSRAQLVARAFVIGILKADRSQNEI